MKEPKLRMPHNGMANTFDNRNHHREWDDHQHIKSQPQPNANDIQVLSLVPGYLVMKELKSLKRWNDSKRHQTDQEVLREGSKFKAMGRISKNKQPGEIENYTRDKRVCSRQFEDAHFIHS